MIVRCPSCATRYLVDPAALGSGGRPVRCARCGHGWHQEPTPDAPDPAHPTTPPAAADEPAPPVRTVANLPVPVIQRPRPCWLCWGAAAALVLIVVGLLFGRGEVERAWPEAARYYHAVGLPVQSAERTPARGLRIAGIGLERLEEAGTSLLVVRGEIRNESPHRLAVPALLATLRDKDGKTLHRWTFHPPQDSLAAEQSLAFEERLALPPDEATALAVAIAPEEGA